MFFKINMLRFCYKAGKKWLSCLSIVLLLGSLFPAAVLGVGDIIISATPGSGSLTETNIRTSGLTIDITLPTSSTWASNIASTTPGDINPVLIPTLKGGFGTTTDVTQWSNLLGLTPDSNFKLVANDVTDAHIQITIPNPIPLTTYDILSDQKVTFTPPASLLQDSSNIPASMFFTITADPQATLSGSLTSGVTESNIVSGGLQLVITLVNCQWASDVATNATSRNTLFSALSATDTTQWTKVYNALIAAPDPSKVITKDSSSTVVTITLPPVPSYNISGLQTVTLSSLNPSLYTSPLGAIPNIINSSFIINSDANSIISLTTTPAALTESSIINGSTPNPSSPPPTTPITLTMTLSDNTWASDITSNLARQTALLNGFTASTDVAAWNKVKAVILTPLNSNFSLSSSHTLIITTPPTPGYSIAANQTVTLNVPSTVLTNNYSLSNKLSFTIIADPAVAVSGTLTAGVNEMDIVNGGKNIVATLTNATWDPSVTTDRTKREQLIDELLASSPAWPTNPANPTDAIATIKAGATYTLTTPTTVTITLPPVPGFNISAPLTITPQIPSLSLLIVPSTGTYTASTLPSFTIAQVSNQSASISGTVTTATESDIVTGGKTLVITLKNDVWAQDVVSDTTKLNLLIDNITATTDTSEWQKVNNAIKANPSNVVRTSDTVLTITLPPVPDITGPPPVSGYALTQDQTINVIIPPTALATASAQFTAGSFTVKAVTATLSGTAVTAPLNSTSVITGGKTIVITLKNATWASDVVTAHLGELKSCFQPLPNNGNWSYINSQITAQNITLSGNNVLTIKLPPMASYSWNNTLELVTFSIPNSSLLNLIKEKLGSTKTLTSSSTVQIGQTVQSPVTAVLSGSALTMAVSDVVLGGKTITITLGAGGSWDPLLPTTSAKISSLVSGFTADSDSTSWAMVQAALKSANLNTNNPFVLSSSNTLLTITLPPVPDYDPVNTQKISLTILKTVLVSATANVSATGGPIQISLPSLTTGVTLQSLLGDGLVTLIKTVPLKQIYLAVPKKYLTSVVTKQTAIGNNTVNSLDIYTDSNVASVNVLVNGVNYTSNISVTYGSGKRFNVGFATVNSTTTSTSSPSSPDAIISVLNGSNSKLQSDATIKISGSKTYSLAPTTDLSGKYSLYKLMNNSSLLTNILKYYVPIDITVGTT